LLEKHGYLFTSLFFGNYLLTFLITHMIDSAVTGITSWSNSACKEREHLWRKEEWLETRRLPEYADHSSPKAKE
jgi:hypothetical protein